MNLALISTVRISYKEAGTMKYVPNALTITRLFLVPIFAYIFFAPFENNHIYALVIFLAAGLTDLLDGYLARKFDVVSKVGIVLDPLADKMMLMTALVCLTLIGIMPAWALWIMLVSEGILILAGIYIYFHKDMDVIPANKYGKMATILFAAAVAMMVLLPDSPFTPLVLVLALSGKIVSFASYGLHLMMQRRGGRN